MVKLTHADYKVGWICALSIEYTAARAMLDEEHEDLEQPETDHNSYALGRVGKHNVAIACLPAGKTGIHSAAIVAVHMNHTFRSLRFGMMIGIGGGVPSAKNDIRLGDVVVSKPGTNNGGVVQYDFGKTIEEGRFVQTGVLNQPPTVLLTAVNRIISDHDFGNYRFVQYISEIPAILRSKFSYLGSENDQLFESSYDHVKGNTTCTDCNTEKLKQREPRDDPRPRIFYGTIACGNQVMRHGETRDRIAKQFDGLCFEMEAAGLMDNFPCIVIRGICDYADSHKNKQWQPYAAVTAAAYAKELLGVISSEAVRQTLRIPSPAAEAPVLSPSTPDLAQFAPEQESLTPPKAASTSSSTAAHTDSLFVLNRQILNSSSIALGRLVIDIHAPWEDYCPGTITPTDDDVGISVAPRLKDMLEKSRGTSLYEELINIYASILNAEDGFEAISLASEKTYLLSNSGNWFQGLCAKHATRAWLENVIKFGWDAYMVVGIHTLCESSMATGGSEERVQKLEMPSGASTRPVPSTSREIIVAFQYRKVLFRWFWSRDVGTAFLEIGSNRWQPLAITRGHEDGEEDIVEATLQDVVVAEDVDREAYTVSGQVIVL